MVSYPVFVNKKVLYIKCEVVLVVLRQSDGVVGFTHRFDPYNLLRVGTIDPLTKWKIVKIVRDFCC